MEDYIVRPSKRLFELLGNLAHTVPLPDPNHPLIVVNRTWTCPANMVKCADGLQCVRSSAVCDGFSNCFDNSDEVRIEVKPGVWDECASRGSFCVHYPKSQWWLSNGQDGARCDSTTCLEEEKVSAMI